MENESEIRHDIKSQLIVQNTLKNSYLQNSYFLTKELTFCANLKCIMHISEQGYCYFQVHIFCNSSTACGQNNIQSWIFLTNSNSMGLSMVLQIPLLSKKLSTHKTLKRLFISMCKNMSFHCFP